MRAPRAGLDPLLDAKSSADEESPNASLESTAELLHAYLDTLRALADSMAVPGVETNDLFQEACVAFLMIAPSCRLEGRQLASIQLHLERYIDENRGDVRVPTPVHAQVRHIGHVESTMTTDGARVITDEALARAIAVSSAVVQQVRAVVSSTYEPLHVLDELAPPELEKAANFLGGSEFASRAEAVRTEAAAAVGEILTRLTDRQRTVIKLRFGITPDEGECTLGAIGAMLGLSAERVRQIEVEALRRLRSSAKDGDVLQNRTTAAERVQAYDADRRARNAFRAYAERTVVALRSFLHFRRSPATRQSLRILIGTLTQLAAHANATLPAELSVWVAAEIGPRKHGRPHDLPLMEAIKYGSLSERILDAVPAGEPSSTDR